MTNKELEPEQLEQLEQFRVVFLKVFYYISFLLV